MPTSDDSGVLVSDGLQGTIVVDQEDVRGLVLYPDLHRRNGCCRLDGLNGPNLVCGSSENIAVSCREPAGDLAGDLLGRASVGVDAPPPVPAGLTVQHLAEALLVGDKPLRCPTAAGYRDALTQVRVHSLTAANTPGGRLHRLAEYLGLDWPWLRMRCAELGEHGLAGLAEPRSRLLSLDGVDQACRFVGTIP